MTANWVTVGSSSITTSGAPLPAAMALLSAVWVSEAVPVLLNFTVMPGLAFWKSLIRLVMVWPVSQPQNTSSALLASPVLPLLALSDPPPQAARPMRVAAAVNAAKAFCVVRMFPPSGADRLRNVGWMTLIHAGRSPPESLVRPPCPWAVFLASRLSLSGLPQTSSLFWYTGVSSVKNRPLSVS